MKHLLSAAVAAALSISASGLAAAASRTFDVEAFTAIEIGSGLDAVVTVGGAQSVTAESPNQEELDELILEVRDGKLRASIDWDIFDLFDWMGGDRQTRITISVPALHDVSANSGSDVEVTGMTGDSLRLEASSGADLEAVGTNGKAVELNASSGADLRVEGSCESAEVDASSGADLRAEQLICQNVDANASSGASADVHATAALTANVSSGANLSVYGKPAKVEDEVSSGGEFNRRD
jgi:hypothetical protein